MVHPLAELAVYAYCLLVGSIGLSLHAFLWVRCRRMLRESPVSA